MTEPTSPLASREIELKLHAPPTELDALLRDPLLVARRVGEPRTERALTVYYDTPGFDLARHGVAFRVRRLGNRRLQTIKTRRHASGAEGAAADRSEWEWAIRGDDPDLSLLTATEVAELLPPASRDALRPVFSTEIERTRVELAADDETRVELALDRGMIRAGEQEKPVSEVELELLPSNGEARPSALYKLALELQRGRDLSVATESKADKGYAMIDADAAAARKAPPLELADGISVGDAFRAIARNCLAHLLDNQAAALAGTDIEGIHQMRIAVRRLRTALVLFRKILDKSERKTVGGELKWLAGELGTARDWDVFVNETLNKPSLREALGGDNAAALAALVEPAREAARVQAVAALRSARYTTFVLTLGLLLEEDRWGRGGAEWRVVMPLQRRAPRLLDRRAAAARRAGKGIAGLDPEERHELRKSLKTFRYAATFLRPLYPGKRVTRYLSQLAHLQDLLGELNDFETARALMAEIAGPAEPRATLLVTAIEQAEAERLAQLPAAWKEFRKATPFWEK
jgi:triphosphatase